MGPFQSDPHRDDERFEGRGFPSEAGWLDRTGADSPDELPVSSDFVERTLRAVREDLAAGTHAGEAEATHEEPDADSAALDRALASTELPAELLRALAAPEPAADFVTRTVAAVHSDRRARWHELLARYVAPEPSSEFVARTLSALTADRQRSDAAGRDPGRRDRSRGAGSRGGTMAVPRSWAWTRAWPLLAIAAAALFWFAPWTPPRVPLELRLALNEPPAFAYSYAATPLPAVLASLSHAADTIALTDSGADGIWLLLERKE
jgi:hypothetical protein